MATSTSPFLEASRWKRRGEVEMISGKVKAAPNEAGLAETQILPDLLFAAGAIHHTTRKEQTLGRGNNAPNGWIMRDW